MPRASKLVSIWVQGKLRPGPKTYVQARGANASRQKPCKHAPVRGPRCEGALLRQQKTARERGADPGSRAPHCSPLLPLKSRGGQLQAPLPRAVGNTKGRDLLCALCTRPQTYVQTQEKKGAVKPADGSRQRDSHSRRHGTGHTPPCGLGRCRGIKGDHRAAGVR